MRLLAFSLAVGAATAVSPFQHVLQSPKQLSNSLTKSLQNLHDSFKLISGEARAVWDEVAMMFPESMDHLSFLSSPKKHSRRPEKQWDRIIKGAEIQQVWVENEDGAKERDIDGHLEAYNLRTKTVDPSVLGVDPGTRQYSGYLDDNENDKHLFYCMPYSRSKLIRC